MKTDLIVAKARECIGVKFARGGRSLKTGMDCVGVPAYVATELSLISEPILQEYPAIPPQPLVRQELARHLDYIKEGMSAAQAGDVVLLEEGRMAIHLGILTEHASRWGVIHCMALQPRCVVEVDLDIKKVRGIYRFRGV